MNRDVSFSLNTLDMLIIASSVLVMVFVGIWASRRQGKTAKDYFLASGKLPWWLIGVSFVSTSVSSEQIVGTVGQAYKHGMGVANWEWWSMPVYFILIMLFIPIYMRTKITTMPELLSRRFSPACGSVYTYVMLFAYVFVFMVPVLYGGAIAFERLTGYNFYLVLWVIIFLVALYTIKGGLQSVVWADTVQCMMLVGGGLILYFCALNKIPGGWAAMEAANPDRFHLYCPPNDPLAPFAGIVAGTLGLFVFYSATNQVMIQRVLGARSRWDGIMGIIFAGFINLLRPLITCFLGFIVYHWIHEMGKAEPLTNLDYAFPFALHELTPNWGLRGVILSGFIAAIMAAISALANSTATIFSLDVYKRILRPEASEKEQIRMGRVASFAALAIAGLVAPLVAEFGGIFAYFQQGITFIASPFAAVILAGVLWRRANAKGAFWGLMTGMVITMFLLMLVALKVNTGLHWLYLGFLQELVVLAVIVSVSLATPAPSPEQWTPFVWRPSFLRETVDEAPRPWYKSLVLWFSIFAIIWCALYYRFW